jgi:hypothetical protein
MSTPQFRAGNPLAPEKGAFPLDHFGECTSFKEKYLECLRVRGKFLSQLFLSLSLDSFSVLVFFFRRRCPPLSPSFSRPFLFARAREQREKADSNRCKLESKMYLECRMAKELMAEQPLATLGFREEHDDKDENNNNNNNDTENEKNAREEENEKNGFVAGARRARQQRREMEESRRSRR